MIILLQEEKRKLWDAANDGDNNTIELFAMSGVDVTGIIDDEVSMCIHNYAIQYNVLFDNVVQ